MGILIEALTDNRNRTRSEMRNLLASHGGILGEPGSVVWTSEKKGVIVVDRARHGEEDLLAAIDAGAEDVALASHAWEASPRRAIRPP